MIDRKLIGDASTEAGSRTKIPARFYEKDFSITAVLLDLTPGRVSQLLNA
ncbi:MAG: hypothetical protein ACYCV4_02875 [Dermatophilaceae bacterium]